MHIFQVDEFSNRVANVFKAQGLKNGDAVALMVENRPEFVCFWLGLSKLGVITALINTNLRQTSLAHSVNVANCQAFIYSSLFAQGELFNTSWLFCKWLTFMFNRQF